MQTPAARFRRLSGVAGAVLAVEAAAIVVVLAVTERRVLLPVEVAFTSGVGRASGAPVQVAQIDLGVAVVVLCLFVAVARVVGVRLTGARPGSRVAESTARWVEFSVTASVTVFLVAAINGVTQVTTLVLVYAATSGAALFGLLQERVEVRNGHPKLALCFGAGLGIVPWGIVAFQQVGAGIAGEPPTALVRVITLVMLAFAAAFAVTQWRAAGPAGAACDTARVLRGEWMHVLLSLASTSVFAWLVVLGVVLPG